MDFFLLSLRKGLTVVLGRGIQIRDSAKCLSFGTFFQMDVSLFK